MKRKLEQIGITPRIYHFEENVKPFTAITIAEDRLTWVGVRRELDRILPRLNKHIYRKATHLRKALRRIDIYGVEICDSRDNSNRRRRRTIAKERFWKHLEQEKRGRK